jgi:predicted AAA+ superfamily ATPase
LSLTKTTLTQKLARDLTQPILWLTGDDPAVRALMADISLARLRQVVGTHQVVVIDEAQRLTNAGLTLKLLTDHFPQVQLLATGSSSLDLAVLKNCAPLKLRDDTGALWENFLIAERQKRNAYADYLCNRYFWRTQAQQEIDYVEEHDGRLAAYAFKWSAKRKARFPQTFLQAYPHSHTAVITPEDFEACVGIED